MTATPSTPRTSASGSRAWTSRGSPRSSGCARGPRRSRRGWSGTRRAWVSLKTSKSPAPPSREGPRSPGSTRIAEEAPKVEPDHALPQHHQGGRPGGPEQDRLPPSVEQSPPAGQPDRGPPAARRAAPLEPAVGSPARAAPTPRAGRPCPRSARASIRGCRPSGSSRGPSWQEDSSTIPIAGIAMGAVGTDPRSHATMNMSAGGPDIGLPRRATRRGDHDAPAHDLMASGNRGARRGRSCSSIPGQFIGGGRGLRYAVTGHQGGSAIISAGGPPGGRPGA